MPYFPLHASHPLFRAAALFTVMLITLPAAQAEDIDGKIRSLVAGLQRDWNSGDMTAYLDAYRQDQSMSLTFGNTVVQGWDALNTLFRSSYPDPLRMGKFTIDTISVTPMGESVAIAYGNFTHVFPEETIVGGYSHVYARGSDGRWLIQHERTSRAEVLSSH